MQRAEERLRSSAGVQGEPVADLPGEYLNLGAGHAMDTPRAVALTNAQRDTLPRRDRESSKRRLSDVDERHSGADALSVLQEFDAEPVATGQRSAIEQPGLFERREQPERR